MRPGLLVTDLTVGEGPPVREGDDVSITFIGWVLKDDGHEKALVAGSERHRFVIGENAVIEGWDLGIRGMSVGGSRRLIVPPDLGYRALGLEAAGIPGNATLAFEITLDDVKR